MKRFLSVVLALCMVFAVLPSIALAADANAAVRTAYFNNQSEWKLTDGDTGSDNVLVASRGNDGWQAASSFTDLDGAITSQTGLNGSGFNSPRNALVAFKIPTDIDFDLLARVTLSLTIKNVKQVTSGARLAVYGNSINGNWSDATGKEAFGASGSDSGISSLTCLGLMTAIKTGNQTGETASGETVTLASRALTEYVREMAERGYTEVTFRIATPLGGIRIYDYNSSYAPTLAFEEGELTDVDIVTVVYDEDGSVVSETVTSEPNYILGETYVYEETPEAYKVIDDKLYVYSKDDSVLTVEAGREDVVIAYVRYEGQDSFSGYQFAEEGAWCWFADPRTISYKNDEGTIDVTIIGYIDVHGNIKAMQINNLTNKADEVLIRSNIQPDDHNNPTFLVLPDERIIVFYSRHTDERCFWYRVTEKKGDITTFGEEKCLATSANTTYPSPFILSDDPDNIYLCWRGIGWHPTVAKISIPDENGDMHFTYGPYQMVQSTGARPYAKYASNGKDKIFMSYTTGHPDNEDTNWLYFNQINIADMTLENINGKTLSTIADKTLAVNKTSSCSSFAVDSTSGVRDWLWQVAVAKDGTPVIAMVKINGGKTSHDYYYVKWNGSSWTKTFLTNAGGRFHSSNTEYCYSGGMGIDADNPNVIYCSKPVAGVFGNVYEIFKYTMSDDGSTVLEVEQITKNSRKNNVRPFVIPGTDGNNVIWMNGDYAYWMVNKNYPSGYPTSAMMNVPLPTEETALDDCIAREDYADIGGAFVSTTEMQSEVMFDADPEYFENGFTVSADIYLAGDYEGKILDMGGLTFSVEKMTTQYKPGDYTERPRAVVNIDGKDYVSPNVYGTSEDWKYYSSGTNGDYYFSQYDGYVNIILSYDGEYLTLYREGLIDLKISAESVEIEKLLVGGFDGYVKNAVVYDRALNNDEIRALAAENPVVADPGVKGQTEITINYVTDSGRELIPSETVTLNPNTSYFTLNRNAEISRNGALYKLNKEKSSLECEIVDGRELSVTAVYDKFVATGENLVPSGSFKDENGSFDWGTWQSARGDGYFKDICSDWFFMVDKDTNNSVLYTNTLAADDYALGTRWNDGVQGLCSMVNFIPVEAGKTYSVSYDYKHKTAGTNASSIRTTFQPSAVITTNDGTDNHTPASVTTSWQTNEFLITAPTDGYIYFHFSWVGSGGSTDTGSNNGEGPFWYFDNFSVREFEEVPDVNVDVQPVLTAAAKTTLSLTNKTKNDLTNVSVYVSSLNDNGDCIAVDAETLDIAFSETEEVSFNVGGNIKVFVWDENMTPLCDVFTSNVQSQEFDPEAPVMVVESKRMVLYDNVQTIKLTGVSAGETVSVVLSPDEADTAEKIENGNVIIYSIDDAGYAANVSILLSSSLGDLGELNGVPGLITTDVNDWDNVNVAFGEITAKYGNTMFELNDNDDIYYIASPDGCNYTLVQQYGSELTIKSASMAAVKVSNPAIKYYAFVKTTADWNDEVTDVVIFRIDD